jgi:O-succinylbenzoic acid--CoA ligase
MLKALLDADKDNVLSRLRAVLVGGAAVSPALLDACRRQRVPALTTYGLTEACSQVTSQSPSDAAPAGSGRPLQGVELRIVGLDGADSPRGDVGNILLRGPMLMDGYWKQPPLHGAWFDTGDLGSLDPAGNLHVASRRVDLVVTGGENVYPLEVEQTLEGCVGVGRALVFGVPDDTWGQLVAAAIVVDAECNEGALFDELRSKLASHKRPRLVCFVNELPLLPSGKLARHNASARFAVRPWEVNA